MIKINKVIVKKQKNFWNNCIFHPTDAVEDSWGKRILDKMANDKAIHTVRIYAMFEDIVYEDENGELAYDFRTNDVRLDYLVEKGYDILIAYGMMPKCIARNPEVTSACNKNKTRYKGKVLYTSGTDELQKWEDICYEYTKHLVERYGIDVVSKWHLHCYNEPDASGFYLPDIPETEAIKRCDEYMKLYEGFINGILRCTDKLKVGGPSLSHSSNFLEHFLEKIKQKNLRLDYLALHNYARTSRNTAMQKGFDVNNWMDKLEEHYEIIKKHGFENTELVYDEWGMSSGGFCNIEECPFFIERETEVFSSYFARLINKTIERGIDISKLMICLSGQHEMTVDFSGFRNFFTLNFIAKPIYNAYVLASRLYEGILEVECENQNIYTTATKSDSGSYSVLITYASDKHEERKVPDITEKLHFAEDIKGRQITLWCIDKENTNPYNLYKKMGKPEVDKKTIKILKEEGKLKPYREYTATEDIKLKLTANCLYLIEVK